MAWGFWNKIKKGFQKVGRAIVKGAKWVNDKVLKPFKPIVKTVANAIIPGHSHFAPRGGSTFPFCPALLAKYPLWLR